MKNEITYPKVDRSKIDFSDSDEINIGYAEGILSDGRPYRLECWAVDQITNLTIFISSIGINHYSSANVLDYLEAEGFTGNCRVLSMGVHFYSLKKMGMSFGLPTW